jgi:RNA polymerase sigma-B factor
MTPALRSFKARLATGRLLTAMDSDSQIEHSNSNSLSTAQDCEAAFARYARTRNPALRDRLVIAHASLVRYLASKFATRGEPLEDLIQVGTVGLINAVERYEPNRGLKFSTFATPTIVGEIQRYFRDKCWKLKVPRRLKDLNVASLRARSVLAGRLGRTPTVAEVAAEIGATEEETLEAMELGNAYDPPSLDAQVGDTDTVSLGETIGGEDPALAAIVGRAEIEQALETLDERDRAVIKGLYFDELSQTLVAERLNLSQMHISRLHKRAIAQLQRRMRADIDRDDAAELDRDQAAELASR